MNELPASIESERALLGCVMESASSYDVVSAAGFSADDLALDSHRRIYSVIAAMREAGEEVDIITLSEKLRSTQLIDAVGGITYLSTLTEGVVHHNCKRYAKTIQEKAKLRTLISASTRCIESAYEQIPSGECAGQLEESLLSLQAGSEQPAQSVGEFSNEAYADWMRLSESESELVGLTTGLECVDFATTGIRPHEFWVIGGRTGDGKTSVALQVAAANARKDIPVAFFSIEMPKSDLLQRLWSHQGQIPFHCIRRPKGLSSDVHRAVRKAVGEVSLWPLYIYDGPLTLNQLQAKSRLLIRQKKIQLIIVDYLQLLDIKAKDERERMTKASSALRVLAKESAVPVVALSQLSRPRDGSPNARPNKYSLKESGSIENDAHVVLMPWRPVDDVQRPIDHQAEMIIAKQRHGSVGPELVSFDPLTFTFRGRR